MTRLDVDSDLDRLGEALRAGAAIDLAREHQAAHTDRPDSGRATALRRPRILAGSTLGLAGVGAALVLALGGTAATSPAFAVTRQQDGSVLVQIKGYPGPGVEGAERQLQAMGINEYFEPRMAPGAATTSGPVTCTRAPGVSGPQVEVLLGTDGTQVITAGQTAGNTGVGTWHMTGCDVYSGTSPAGSGNTGAG